MSISLRATGEGLVLLIGAVVCLLAANRGSSCLLTRAMDGRIVRCGIISSCQSAATCEIVKALLVTYSCKKRYNKYRDLYLLPVDTYLVYTKCMLCSWWITRVLLQHPLHTRRSAVDAVDGRPHKCQHKACRRLCLLVMCCVSTDFGAFCNASVCSHSSPCVYSICGLYHRNHSLLCIFCSDM